MKLNYENKKKKKKNNLQQAIQVAPFPTPEGAQ